MAAEARDILYGIHAIQEALRSDQRPFERILMAEGRREREVAEVLRLAARRGVPVELAGRAELTELAGTPHHQGLVAVVTRRMYLGLGELLARLRGTKVPALLLADGVEDPANLGAMVRSAEVLGFHGVIIPRRRAAGVTPAVVRASAGAAEHLPIAQVGNMTQAIARLKDEGLWIVGFDASAEVACFEADLLGPVGIVVGSEGRGIRRLVREQCDLLVSVPVSGRVSSLNVAAASAVAMYEVMRQRWVARGSGEERAGEGEEEVE